MLFCAAGTALAEGEPQDLIGPQPAQIPVQIPPQVLSREVSLAAVQGLRLRNARGNVKISASRDEKLKLRASVSGLQAIEPVFEIRVDREDQTLSISVEPVRQAELAKRIQAVKKQGDVSTDIEILAPPRLMLEVSTARGAFTLEGWEADLRLRSDRGEIHLNRVRAREVLLQCMECKIHAKEVSGSVRALLEEGEVSLDRVSGPSTYVDARGADILLKDVRSNEQTYVTSSGRITGERLEGTVHFESQTGDVKMVHTAGSVSGRTTSGGVALHASRWATFQKSIFETRSGPVELILPEKFSAQVELKSEQGRVSSDYLLESAPGAPKTTSLNWVRGRVGRGSGELTVLTKSGWIRLRKL